MPGHSLELVVSSISVTVKRGHTLKRQSSVQVLSRLASIAKLLRSADGRFCTQVPVGDRLEINRLKSAAFRDGLIDGFLIDQPEPPSSWAIRRVVGMLEARVRFNTRIPEVLSASAKTATAAPRASRRPVPPHHESSRLNRWNGSSTAPSRKPKRASELRRKPHL
jgi:hypothetical protein